VCIWATSKDWAGHSTTPCFCPVNHSIVWYTTTRAHTIGSLHTARGLQNLCNRTSHYMEGRDHCSLTTEFTYDTTCLTFHIRAHWQSPVLELQLGTDLHCRPALKFGVITTADKCCCGVSHAASLKQQILWLKAPHTPLSSLRPVTALCRFQPYWLPVARYQVSVV
jgi:hypothetical protein